MRAPLVVDALGWRRVLSRPTRDPAAARAPVARARGPPRTGAGASSRSGSTPPTSAPATAGASRRRARCGSAVGSFEPRDRVKEPTVALAARPRARRGPLPGQLDPAPAARGHRGRRLLRRRLRRALPAADRRGHPPRVLLRARARARAARGAQRAPDARGGRSRATAPSAPGTAGRTRAMLAAQHLVGRLIGAAPMEATVRAVSRPPPRALDLRALPRDRAAASAAGHAPRPRHAQRDADDARGIGAGDRSRPGSPSLRVEPVRPDADVDGERRVELPGAGHLALDDRRAARRTPPAGPRTAARRGSGGSGASASRRARRGSAPSRP